MKNQLNQNTKRPYGGNKDNDGPRQNRMEGQNKIKRVKLNVLPFKGRSDLDAYLDWEMKIEHVFSYNDYTEEQKVKLAATEFSNNALVWWNKNQREMIREEG